MLLDGAIGTGSEQFYHLDCMQMCCMQQFSVTLVHCLKIVGYIIRLFSHLVAPIVLNFSHQTSRQNSISITVNKGDINCCCGVENLQVSTTSDCVSEMLQDMHIITIEY